jgi:type II secretory pathway component PulF
MFGGRYSFDGLATWCRMIRHGHGAGLTLIRVFELQAKNGPAELRPAAARIARKLEAGEALEDALTAEAPILPEMFVSMAGVGERTGRIPEVFGQLEEYYRLQAQMKREFRSQAAWPVFQFVGAVLVIAFVIWIFGFLEPSDATANGPVGFGLIGAPGAILFLVVVGSTVGGAILAYKLMTKSVAKMAAFEAWLLRVPVIGPFVQASALSRFCLALRLTLDSSLSITKAIRLSLKATGNNSFIEQTDRIIKRLKKGDELRVAIGTSSVFPAEFLASLNVGEESGQIPEVMARLAENYREETARRAKALTRAMAWGVYVLVGFFIILAIFQLAGVYVKAVGG